MSSSRGPSRLRDQTHVSYICCTGRWVLHHQCRLVAPTVAEILLTEQFHPQMSLQGLISVRRLKQKNVSGLAYKHTGDTSQGFVKSFSVSGSNNPAKGRLLGSRQSHCQPKLVKTGDIQDTHVASLSPKRKSKREKGSERTMENPQREPFTLKFSFKSHMTASRLGI